MLDGRFPVSPHPALQLNLKQAQTVKFLTTLRPSFPEIRKRVLDSLLLKPYA
jgi:hypothetical protein